MLSSPPASLAPGQLARRVNAGEHGAVHDVGGGAAGRVAAGGNDAGRVGAADGAAQHAGQQPQLQPAEEDELLLPEEHEAEELETALAAPEDAGISYYFVRARKAGPRSDVYAAARVGDLERARCAPRVSVTVEEALMACTLDCAEQRLLKELPGSAVHFLASQYEWHTVCRLYRTYSRSCVSSLCASITCP